MIPTSNNNNLGCNPISSNCVIWQGPDINCGNLVICNGDSVSDVVAKLAEELCDATYSVALNIDVKCLEGIADPTNLDEVVQALIDKVCETTPPVPSPAPDSNLYPLPVCLVENGVVNATVSQYVQLLGAKVCSIANQITQLTNQLNALTDRVEILEGYFPLSNDEVQIVSQCILKDQTVGVSALVAAFEQEYCLFSAAVGTESLVRSAIGAQCINGNDLRLSGSGTYSAVSGWQTAGNEGLTLAQSHWNQWTVICDLYNAVTGILENCCGGGCESVQFGFTYSLSLNQTTNLPENLNVNFTSCIIPNDFSDCNGSTQIQLTDSNGNSVTFPVNVTNQQNNGSGVNYDLGSSGLDLTSSLQIRAPFCVTNGSDTCSDTQTQSIPLAVPCPTGVQVTSLSNTSVRVQFDAALPSGWFYSIRLKNNNSIVDTYTIASPGAGNPIDYTFSGLLPGTEYCVEIAISETNPNLRFSIGYGNTAPASTAATVCASGCITTAGSLCNTTEVTSIGSEPYPLTSRFLGVNNVGPESATYNTFYYDPLSQRIYANTTSSSSEVQAGVSFSNYSAVGGSITIDLKANAGNGTSVTQIYYEYSLDNGATYQGQTSVAVGNTIPQTVTINTGAADGTIYIKAYTDTGSGDFSFPSVIRYDFITDEFIPIFDLNNPDSTLRASALGSNTGSGYRFNYAAGQILESTSILQTDGNSYTVPGGSSRSRWAYYGKVTDLDGIKKHLWAAWINNDTNGEIPPKVVLACDCPAFVNPSPEFTKSTFVGSGLATTITIPYIIGGGTPYMTIISQPQFGSLSQSVAGDNTVVYQNNGSGAGIGDTFRVQFSSEIAGDCLASDIYTVQIQILSGSGSGYKGDGNIYHYVDTTSFSTADADRIKALRDKVKLDTIEASPDWKGEVYLIPVNDSRFLRYTKSIVDDGASAILDTDPAWVGVRNLPPSWSGGTNAKENASVIIMSNASPSIYHDTTLAAGFGSTPNIQPTTQYLEDYEEYLDIVNGTEVSAWAQSQAFGGTSPFDDLTVTYYPITTDTTGSNAAAILQGLASYAGKMINPLEYGVRTAVDVSGYLMQGLVPSAVNPYEGAVTPGGVTLEGLFKQTFNVFLDQPTNNVPLSDYLDEMLTENAGGFLDKLDKIVLGTTGGATIPATGPKYEVDVCGLCPSNPIIQDISGGAALNIGDSHTFYIQGSPLTGEIVATSVAAADYVASEIGPVLSPAGPPCDLVPELAYLEFTACSGGMVFRFEVDKHTLCPGDIVALTNNSGVNIPSTNGSFSFADGATACFTVGTLVAPEQVNGVVTYTSHFADCPTCLPSHPYTFSLYE